MNYGISVLFRAIPLLMALFCFGYGAFVLQGGTDASREVAGPVLLSLGMICIALFATAAVIIRQIIGTFNRVVKYLLPAAGYVAALLTFIMGICYIGDGVSSSHFVAGHVICGVAFITACVSTTATASTRFTLIPVNARRTDFEIPPDAFSVRQACIIIGVAVLFSMVAWVWAFWLLSMSRMHPAYYIAGHVVAGLACICTSLVALITTIVRQIRNTHRLSERRRWSAIVLFMGTLNLVWGLIVLADPDPAKSSTGYIMIGLGLVCYSISSKVILLAATWRNSFALSKRIPLIPIFTALACFFLASFLFEMASYENVYFIPARVLAGLGGICFTLFSIVSILESGTSAK